MTDFASEIAAAPNRAAAGAEWFDENHPGWHTKINPETLDISHDCNCMVGQLYGSFVEVAGKLMRPKMQVARGILVPRIKTNLSHLDQYYEALTSAWRQEVSIRLAA